MSEDERLSDVDRQSLRILARSSRDAAPDGRLSEHLERAAQTGSRLDYEKAERTFDTLSPADRMRIGRKAEQVAESERAHVVRRKGLNQGPSAPAPKTRPSAPTAPSGDEALEWKPIFAPSAPGAEPSRSEEAPRSSGRRKAVTARNADEPAEQLFTIPGTAKSEPPPRGAKPKKGSPSRPPVDELDGEEHKDWNWRDIPEDPVLNGGRKKAGPADPIEELRRAMLGLDAKYGKR